MIKRALETRVGEFKDVDSAVAFAALEVQRLLTDPNLIKQTKVNPKKQFVESQDFQAAVTEAVAANQDAHNTMADYFFTDGPAINSIIIALADAFYEAAVDQQVDS
ncbi:hypothetical protein AB0O39_20000 [Streptomyces anulatus]|uniref:hypothetical protein n=1 Tax=Streptomyces anulatus TaxID=1892 RepID=UPI0034363160